MNKEPSLNIAIYTVDFNWAGGIDLLHGLVKGLLTQKKRRCRIYVLVHDPSVSPNKSAYRKLVDVARATVQIVRNASGLKKMLLFKKQKRSIAQADYQQIHHIKEIFSNEEVEIIYYNDYGYEGKLHVLQRIKADVVLPVLMNGFPPSCPIPWVGYLFDFVYKYHTHLYTKEFCLYTDINYATTLLHAKAVIVNSKATCNDLYKFIPYAKAKVYSLPFAPYTNEHIYKAAVAEGSITDKYKIKQPYFIISNQFWLHKSHETAFEALRILRNDLGQKNITIVCTGRMTDLSGTDERKKQLLQFVAGLDLAEQIHFLGHIPKVDQLALMLRSVAVLQPTLFEGGPGGGAVYMAVANGVPAIVSDIEVNREIQNESLVSFFKASDPKDLASKMKAALSTEREHVPYEVLSLKNQERLTLLGDTLIDCIEFTIQAYRKS